MKKIWVSVLALFFTTLLSQCSFTGSKIDDKPNEKGDEPVYHTFDDIDYISYDNDLYHAFFDVNSKVEIKIDISPTELALIQSDYEYYKSIGSKSPIYRQSDVTITVNDIEYFYDEVGIRMKGNTSRTNFYNDTDGMYEMIHFKLSFKQTFDDEDEYENPKVWSSKDLRDERKDRLFAGMEKIDLKWNRPKDVTYSREYWTYEMFRTFGVLAPQITPVNLKMNYSGIYENFGVVYAMETIDELFLEKRLAPKHLEGDLYKVGWDHEHGGNLTLDTLNRIGVEDENASYFPVYDLKTNKKTSDHEHMKNLITKLNSEDKPETLVHLDYYLRFEMVSYLVGNPDDLRNHYNNYYIYFLKDSDLAIFIPYDYDRTFGISWDWNPTGNAMTSYSPYTLRTTMGGVNDQVNPLIIKTIARGSGKDDMIQDYRALVLEGVASKFFDINKLYEIYEIHKAKYKDVTHYSLDKLSQKETKFNKEETENMSVKNYIDKKLETVETLIDSY